MLTAKIIRKSAKRWPEKLVTVNREFLPKAGNIVLSHAQRNVPVDKGILRASLNSRITVDQAIIGTNVNYAPYQEYGTTKMKAQPYLRPAVDKNRKGLVALWKSIFRRVYGR